MFLYFYLKKDEGLMYSFLHEEPTHCPTNLFNLISQNYRGLYSTKASIAS